MLENAEWLPPNDNCNACLYVRATGRKVQTSLVGLGEEYEGAAKNYRCWCRNNKVDRLQTKE